MSLVPGKMMKEGTSVKDTEISRVDQDKINAFSRMNMKAHFIREDIKALKEELDKLEDANTIVEDTFMGMDGDDAISLFVGECFVHANEDQANQYLEKVQEEKQAELEKK
jgi:prefoldin subunit 4